jgi:hypothetical protein
MSRPRKWYSVDLLETLAKVPAAVVVKVVGSIHTSGYLTARSGRTIYKVRMCEGMWSPIQTANGGDLSQFVRGVDRAAA